MADYRLNQQTFTIDNYNQKRPFSSFLPGIAGLNGIPLWAFYVNRGQGISGFGLQDKNHPIMAFTPANKAYESASVSGFRTFVKVNNDVYEPFHMDNDYPASMMIDKDAFAITETHPQTGLKVSVKYFGLPEEPVAGLIRRVTFENTSSKSLQFEALDGMAEILPAGIANDVFKSLSNIMASWITVEKLNHQLGFFKLRSSTSDSSEVKAVTEGHYYIGQIGGQRITPIVDPKIVFRYNTTKSKPVGFAESSLKTLKEKHQVTTNQLPCAFIPFETTLAPQESITLYALVGHVQDYAILDEMLPQLSEAFFQEKEARSEALIKEITHEVATQTAFPHFDAYIEQCYLDNVLRGGYPVQLGTQTYHLYSRRHGDLERDYNFFSLAPEFYSQGNGNFRDVCQNRRLDTVIHPEVEAFNIYHFTSLIQLDGYNPLSVNGVRFKRDPSPPIPGVSDALSQMLKNPFSPGQIMHQLLGQERWPFDQARAILEAIMKGSEVQLEANFGEGYWIDHFTYILDLIESSQAVYPDKMHTVVCDEAIYKTFESPVSVKPLSEKQVEKATGEVRQYHSLRHPDQEKINQLKLDIHQSAWVKLGPQNYQSTLYEKLLTLILNKHSHLDPLEVGVEMEAEKPGWNDAMNGLPGLFGSGVSETIELLRLIRFLKTFNPTTIKVPDEIKVFFDQLRAFPDYSKRVSQKEAYRESIRFGLKGSLSTLDLNQVMGYLNQLEARFNQNLQSLEDDNQGLLPSFLFYEKVPDAKETFKMHALPHFLEAPARSLKLSSDGSKGYMHQKILKSNLYDPHLKIFKTSVPLEKAPDEIGRIKAFTEGWLERESNFLHMTYKYMLGLLKAGLYEAFYETLPSNLVCFMNPEIYGRSPLENSSFIVPSNNPDESIHGQGFFARLSGSTVEALHMWFVMMTGGQPFKVENDTLKVNLQPKLHHSYFKDHAVTFTLFNQIQVTYINEANVSTYDRCEIEHYVCEDKHGQVHTYDVLEGEVANKVRQGHFKKITIYMNKIGGKQ